MPLGKVYDDCSEEYTIEGIPRYSLTRLVWKLMTQGLEIKESYNSLFVQTRIAPEEDAYDFDDYSVETWHTHFRNSHVFNSKIAVIGTT